MQSQASFKFDGSHNEGYVVSILKKGLKGLKYRVTREGFNVYRIYVGAQEPKEKTFHVCYGIQCFVVYDNTKDLR